MKWKYLVGILMSAAFVYLAVRKVDAGDLGTALANARYIFVPPAVALMVLSLWFRAVRWRYLMAPVKRVGLGSLFRAMSIGLMANNVLPARIGELARAHVIGERETISRSASFATIVIERVFDGLTLLAFLGVVLLAGMALPPWLEKAAIAAVAFYGVALLFLALLWTRAPAMIRLSERLSRPLPARLRERLLHMLRAFANGLGVLGSWRNVAIATVLSPLVWLPGVAMIHLLLVSFDIHASPSISFLLQVALSIGVMIPSAPGYIGTIQYVAVAVLGLFGVAGGTALSFSLVYHACVFVPIVAIGLACLPMERLSFSELSVLSRRRVE